jgi:hypothetical protein
MSGRSLSTTLRQLPQGITDPPPLSAGLLIHTAVGTFGGAGGLLTNRSGCTCGFWFLLTSSPSFHCVLASWRR